MPSIACDVTALAQNRFGGIARVCFHTAVEAARHDDFVVTACYLKGELPALQIPTIHVSRLRLWSGLIGPTFDLAHSICHRMLPVKARCHLYTVHDAWSLAPNDYQSPAFQKKLGERMRRDLVAADLVTTDSQYTRSEILKYGLIDPAKCVALPIGVTIPDATSVQPTQLAALPKFDKPFVLFVGRLENRKNIPHILEAVRSFADLLLILVGEPGYGYEEKIKPALSSFPSERLLLLNRISESELLWLYQHALATVQPSWEEGFGLPVLEAMAAGCPVITSNRSATVEVAQDSAILVEPDAPEQTRRALQRLRDDIVFRHSAIAAGRLQASSFNWELFGDRLVQLYRSLIAGQA